MKLASDSFVHCTIDCLSCIYYIIILYSIVNTRFLYPLFVGIIIYYSCHIHTEQYIIIAYLQNEEFRYRNNKHWIKQI